MIKVVIASKHFYPLLTGTESQFLTFAQSLQKKGIDTQVITSRFNKSLAKKDIINYIPVTRLFSFGKGFLYDLSCAISFFIWLIMKRRNYDIIHITTASSVSFASIIAAKFLKKKSILTVSSPDIELAKIKQSFFSPILFYILKHADRYIALSEELIVEFKRHGFDDCKICYIPNGVNIDKFRPLLQSEKDHLKSLLKLPNKKIITFVGQLKYRKGIDVLLKSWKQIAIHRDDIYLLIIGAGIEFDRFLNLSKEIGIEKSIFFTGELKNVEQYFQISDIFVFPSRKEGCPNVLLEAMSTGLPIVATPIGGIVDIIRHMENGILIKEISVDSLTDGINFLVNNQAFAQKLGKQAREYIKNHFSIGHIANKYIELYGNLI